ncbi:MAG: anti-sigma-factor antagonist [Chitinophagaceae bacterium]|jgi:anti-anti-sigma factor|nr:anti-sigma-factor antagonist [Chitinophagaceae bacterium]
MEVKFDTKEKFTVITPNEPELTANLAEELRVICEAHLEKTPKSVVLNLQPVESIDDDAASGITSLQQHFYDNSASFVVCGLSDSVEKKFDDLELLDYLNYTPSESEAWDIVQMEEVERELLDSDDIEFETE